MIRGRKVVLLAGSTLLSVALAVAVNVATGGSLPGPLDRLQWLAWPLVAVLALGVAAVGVWEAGAEPGSTLDPAGGPSATVGPGPGPNVVRPAELPPNPDRFAGRRDELDRLLAAVPERPAPGRLGRPVLLGVFGAGGMGKTVLANRLAHTVADRYPDGQVFVELRGASSEPADPGDVQRRLLQTFGVAAADVPEDLDARRALYRSVLADKRLLLYLDDAGSEDQVDPLLPAAEGCLVLVTARPSLMGLGLSAWVELGSLTPDGARAVLQAIAGDADRLAAEPEATADVLRLCGYLPLALSIAGARLRARPQWTVADLAGRLTDESRRLDELQAGHHDMRASIRMSYADLDPVAAGLFRRLSLLGFASFGPGVAAALMGGIAHWPESEVVLERLAEVKLIEIVGHRLYRFHDLVRIFAHEELAAQEDPDARREALLRSLDYYRERTIAQCADLEDPATTDERKADAEQWFTKYRPSIVAAVRRAVDNGAPELAGQIAAAVSPYLEARAYPGDLVAVSEIAVEVAREAGDDEALAGALRRLGQAQRHLSQHVTALSAFTESLAIRLRLGHDGPAAEALQRIGDTHREVGRLAEAEEAYVSAIATFTALDQLHDSAVVQAELALTWVMTGDVEPAVELIERAVGRLVPHDEAAVPDRDGAWALEILGAVRRAEERFDEAEACHRRSLASFRSRGERYGSACALVNLGRTVAAVGRTDDARAHFTEALRLFTEIGNVDGQGDAEQGLASLGQARRRTRSRSGSSRIRG